MKKLNLTFLVLGFSTGVFAQGYTSFFTGSTSDLQTIPQGGTCMMGGSTENDDAMRWFLEGASGGDVLVLRTSGSDGYNDYMYTDLGVNLNSVETIRFDSPVATNNAYVQDRISKAEAIWFAGGDQWNYVSYWRNTAIADLINSAIAQRKIMIGGTSAGMAILGGTYFSAQNGTVTSDEALANPYRADMTVDNTPFLNVPYLSHVITDTHYDDPDRRGRHVAFLAKAQTDFGQSFFGIACDEFTAVCINSAGIARVYGTYPDYDDNAYFLAVNCEITNNEPEQCTASQPLVWDKNGQAIKVYAVKGTPVGLYNFDLNNWQTGKGGVWEDWSVNNSSLNILPSSAPSCTPVATDSPTINFEIKIMPNPTNDNRFSIELPIDDRCRVRLYDSSGRFLNQWEGLVGYSSLFWNFPSKGIYLIEVESNKYGRGTYQLVVK